MRVLVLSGPPAVGKSTLGRLVAAGRPGRCAFIDVDDVRQLVVSGMVAPWKGEEGRRQRRLVVRLDVAFERARERAERRPVYLSWEEFAMLHREQEAVDGADVRVDTTGLSVEETAARVVAVWEP